MEEIIILCLIIILIIIIIYLQNKDSFLNKDDYTTKQIKESISARLNIHELRIINLNYQGNINDGYISVSFDLLPNNKYIDELSNKQIIEKMNELIKDNSFYITVNNKNLRIKSVNDEQKKKMELINNLPQVNTINKELFSYTDDKKDPNKFIKEVKQKLDDSIRGMPFNHNLERYFKIGNNNQVLIEPPELIIEENEEIEEESF